MTNDKWHEAAKDIAPLLAELRRITLEHGIDMLRITVGDGDYATSASYIDPYNVHHELDCAKEKWIAHTLCDLDSEIAIEIEDAPAPDWKKSENWKGEKNE